MKAFENYEDLLSHIGVTFSSHIRYANEELSIFLGGVGSDNSTEPKSSFELDIEGNIYQIGVTYKEVNEEIIFTYWLI